VLDLDEREEELLVLRPFPQPLLAGERLRPVLELLFPLVDRLGRLGVPTQLLHVEDALGDLVGLVEQRLGTRRELGLGRRLDVGVGDHDLHVVAEHGVGDRGHQQRGVAVLTVL
jgi:hypothetical protein